MELLAKFKKILYMGFRATLKFRKFKVAVNLMSKELHLLLLIKICNKKQFHHAAFEI